MTDPLDELMELKPTHASALLLDPVDVAERATLSARGARRRANALLVGMSVVALAVVVVVGALFLRPTQAVPAGSPSPYMSGAPVVTSNDVAAYDVERAGVVVVFGTSRPEAICVAEDFAPPAPCSSSVAVTGLTWSSMPTRDTSGGMTWARALVKGTFDGKTFAVNSSLTEGFALSMEPNVPTPKPKTTSLLTCEVSVVGSGSALEGTLAFDGLEAYWFDTATRSVIVATSGDLGVAVTGVKAKWDGPACIGKLPASGPLADLVAATKRVQAAHIDGVISAKVSTDSAGVLQVDVVANVPGLRERIVVVAGEAIPLTIVPTLYVVKQ